MAHVPRVRAKFKVNGQEHTPHPEIWAEGCGYEVIEHDVKIGTSKGQKVTTAFPTTASISCVLSDIYPKEAKFALKQTQAHCGRTAKEDGRGIGELASTIKARARRRTWAIETCPGPDSSCTWQITPTSVYPAQRVTEVELYVDGVFDSEGHGRAIQEKLSALENELNTLGGPGRSNTAPRAFDNRSGTRQAFPATSNPSHQCPTTMGTAYSTAPQSTLVSPPQSLAASQNWTKDPRSVDYYLNYNNNSNNSGFTGASPFPTPILSSHGYGGQVQHAPPTQNMYPSQTAGSYQGSTGTLPGQAMNYLGRGAQSSQADSQYGSGFPATGFPQSWSSQTSSEKSSREQIQWAGYQPGHDQRGQNRSRQDRRGQYPLDQYQLDQYQPEQYQGRRIQSGQYPTSQIESSQKKQAWYWNSEKQIYEPYNG